MSHMCTYLPDDPEFVLAAPITEENYDIYHNFPTGIHLPFNTVKDHVLMVPLSNVGWGWMNRTTFTDLYEPVDEDRPWSDWTLWTLKSTK